jgi:hypothetical protein
MCPTNTPLIVIYGLWLIKLKNHHINLALHLRVDSTDSRRTFVPEGGNEGADKELPCVNVAQDLDSSPEGHRANLASERQAPDH